MSSGTYPRQEGEVDDDRIVFDGPTSADDPQAGSGSGSTAGTGEDAEAEAVFQIDPRSNFDTRSAPPTVASEDSEGRVIFEDDNDVTNPEHIIGKRSTSNVEAVPHTEDEDERIIFSD